MGDFSQDTVQEKKYMEPEICEKPLSPVLNTRKIIPNRRIHRNKPRKIRPLDKLENKVTKCDIPQEVFTEESFSLSQTSSLFDTLERLEEIERNREKIHKLICNGRNTSFCFKKPMSPASKRAKKTKIVETNQESLNTELPECTEIAQEKITIEMKISEEIPEDVDFTTGHGKTILVNGDTIKEHSKIFSDIFNPFDKCKERKFNFLSKNATDLNNIVKNNKTISPYKSNSNETLLDGGASEPFEDTILVKVPGKNEGKIKNMDMFEKMFEDDIFETTKLEDVQNSVVNDDVKVLEFNHHNDVGLGFQMASGKNIQLSQSAILKATSMFKDDVLEQNNQNSTDFKDGGIYFEAELKLDKESLSSREILKKNEEPIEPSEKVVAHNFEKTIDNPVNNISSKCDRIYNLSHKNDAISKRNVPKNVGLSSKACSIAKNIFEGEQFDDLFSSTSEECGFKTPTISNLRNKEEFSNFNNVQNGSIPPKSNKGFTISGKPLNSVKNIFEDENFDDIMKKSPCSKNFGFEKPKILSSGQNENTSARSNLRAFTISGKPLNSIKNIFEDETLDDIMKKSSNLKNVALEKPKHIAKGFSAASSTKNVFAEDNFDGLFTSASSSFKTHKMLSKTEISLELFGFTKQEIEISQKLHERIEEYLRYSSQILEYVRDGKIPSDFSKWPKLSEEYEPPRKKIKLFEKPTSFDSLSPSKNNLTRRSLFSTPKLNGPDDGYRLIEKRSVKKRLGVPSVCRTIQVSETNLESAKSMFVKELMPSSSSHTPVRDSGFMPKFNSTPLGNNSGNFNVTITPIRNESLVEDSRGQLEETVVPQKFCLRVPKIKNMEALIGEFNDERKILEEQLKAVVEKMKLLEENRKLMEHRSKGNIRQTEGVLYAKKKQKHRTQLKDFVIQYPGDCSKIYDPLFKISPQNADHFHFNFQECISSIRTEDGAQIISNLNRQIGLAEIENSFKIIPGVDPKLIQDGWIKNHYKWIIWKLASYERMFPNKFEDCLCVENVIQQLKYRYDREIDKVERPVLRKIFEKDVASQMRMVLCVSNIVKINNSYELELTDGWYGIRTVIDEPLNLQILRRKIKVGTKLIIHGAELLNCDGCHPLEATDLACLKINFNSTRRARWYTKLGYQKDCGAFPIQIESIHPSGGVIGRVDVYVARVYPTKYIEKRGNVTIWRNQKAEDKARNEFENVRMRKYEEIREKLQQEYYDSNRQNLGKINDEENKYEMYAKLEERIKEQMPMKPFSTPLNKVTVVDILSDSDQACALTVWRQNENFDSIFKEGEILTVLNVLPSKNGELCANISTKYIIKPKDPRKIEKYQRRVTAIALLRELTFEPLFGEFDTVGFVVHIDVGPTQEIWLADHQKRFLLIQIQGSSEMIALPDYKIREVKSVSNLTLRKSGANYSSAVANHWTVFSKYPAQKNLREAMTDFVKELPKDLDKFWNECKENIEKIKQQETSRTNCTFSEDDINCSQITESDRALSLINFDKFM